MRLTIIKPDNAVYVDGYAINIDLSEFPRYFHALQWDTDHGEIEFATDSDGYRMSNVKIVDITPFQPWIDRHAAELDKIKAAMIKAAPSAVETSGGMHAFEE